MDHIPPPDDVAHQDSVLMAGVAEINTRLARYVLRLLDADAGRAAPLSTADERALADEVTAVAAAIRARIARREPGALRRHSSFVPHRRPDMS